MAIKCVLTGNAQAHGNENSSRIVRVWQNSARSTLLLTEQTAIQAGPQVQQDIRNGTEALAELLDLPSFRTYSVE